MIMGISGESGGANTKMIRPATEMNLSMLPPATGLIEAWAPRAMTVRNHNLPRPLWSVS